MKDLEQGAGSGVQYRVGWGMPQAGRSEGLQGAPHGAKAAEVYGIVGYLLSIVAFRKNTPRKSDLKSS